MHPINTKASLTGRRVQAVDCKPGEGFDIAPQCSDDHQLYAVATMCSALHDCVCQRFDSSSLTG